MGPSPPASQRSAWEDTFLTEEGHRELAFESSRAGSWSLVTAEAQEAAPAPCSQQTSSGWKSRGGGRAAKHMDKPSVTLGAPGVQCQQPTVHEILAWMAAGEGGLDAAPCFH